MDVKQKIQNFQDQQIPIRVRDKRTTEVYNKIVLLTSFLQPTAKIKERIYCVMNDITSSPICKQCNTNHVLFLGPSTGYRDYCSVKCSSNSDEKKNGIIATNLKKYGTKTPAESDVIRQKTINTLESRYGDNIRSTQQVESIKQKSIQTNNEKYGSDAYTSSEDFKRKQLITVTEKYGVVHINQRDILPSSLLLLNDRNWLIVQNRDNKKTLLTLADELGVSIATMSVYFKKHCIIPIYYTTISSHEQSLLSFLLSLDINVINQDRNIIKPKELDIVLPDFKIAIEFCGLYWHSDIHPRITKHYHLNKLQQCLIAGYKLITIFEDEWIYKQDIVKSRLLHLLGKSSEITYARKCDMVIISRDQKREFFDSTHIQGNGRGSITYGLSYNNTIVAVMTFMDLNNGNYELNRYSTIGSIVGGFSRLLKHFQRNHSWITISSFADRRWSEGDIYKNHGFELVNISLPSYDYIIKDTRIHRRNFMKGLLSKKLLNYDPNLTEFENCDNNNLLRIWNCGQLKFIKYKQ
jgi:hypothetical protein